MVAEVAIKDSSRKSVREHEGDSLYRQIPHNIEAEAGLLGALLVDNRALERTSDFLKADHFFAPAHQRIFTAISKLIERGQTANPVTLKAYFEQDSDLAHGVDLLAQAALASELH